MEHLLPWLRLQLTPGLGRARLIRLITHYNNAEKAISSAGKGWPKQLGIRPELARMIPKETEPRVQKALDEIKRINGWMLNFQDTDYPEILHQLPDPPAVLYGCGKLPPGPALAMVGARYPTHCGKTFTEQLATQISAAGVTIISGLARGIDTAAHKGALNGHGKTVAVLGCGIDRIYPKENEDLFWQITEHGAVISEYPPGTAPLPGHFPGRNRIISGLSKATLVVEAARDSGSLITAEFALEQGRDVMAVPGGVDRKTSYGPNLLIKQGAHPVTEASEILQIIGHQAQSQRLEERTDAITVQLDEPHSFVLSLLDLTPRHSDELAGQSGLTAMELSAILLQLELQGVAEKLPGGCYVRTS